jgi:hypothetical protein
MCVLVHVRLRAVDHPHEAVLQADHVVLQHVQGVGALVHEVELGDDPDGALAGGVHLPSELQCLGVGEVDGGERDGHDDGSGGGGNVLQDYLSYLCLDVCRLVPHRQFRESGEVNQC